MKRLLLKLSSMMVAVLLLLAAAPVASTAHADPPEWLVPHGALAAERQAVRPGFKMPTYEEYVASEKARNELKIEAQAATAYGSGRPNRLVHLHDYFCDPVGAHYTTCTDTSTGYGPLYWIFTVGGRTEWGGPLVGTCLFPNSDSNSGWRQRWYWDSAMSLYGPGDGQEKLVTFPTPCDDNTACAAEYSDYEYGAMIYINNAWGVWWADCVH